MEQLAGFGLLKREVVFHDNALHKMLVDGFAVFLPCLAVMCYEDVIPSRDQIVRHITMRAVGVDVRLLVEQLLDEVPIRENYRGPWAELQREDAAVGLCPGREC